MKCKLLRQITIMSTYAIIGVYVQCLLAGILLAADSEAQQKSIEDTYLTISIDNLPLEEALLRIGERTEFNFQYSKRLVRNEKLNLEIRNATLGDLLREISTKTGLSFKRINETIYVVKPGKQEEAVSEVMLENQEITVTGQVASAEDDQGLPGVNVIIKGTAQGTVTDLDGRYSIDVPDENSVLVFSSVGFLQQEVTVGNQTVIDVLLEEDITALEEIVVIGYGTQEKKDLTGSIASIDNEALGRQPAATNVTELLRGTVPGVNVGISTSARGTSGLEVRGPTSLGTNNSPLIVLDDVIYQGDIADINPADIERVDVLKDASAAAIYGSRAAAGVVIITTKKGVEAKPTVTIRSSVGMARAGIIEDVYGPEGYLYYRADVVDRFDVNSPPGYYSRPSELPDGVTLDDWLAYDNLQGTTTPPEDIWLGRLQLQEIEVENYKAGNFLDYRDIVFQNGLRTDNNISLSGQTNNVSYYTSLGYVDNDGILVHQNYQNFRARINLEAKVNKWLSVGWNVQGSVEREPQGIPNNVVQYERGSPLGSLYNPDGTYKVNPHDDAMATNPLMYEYHDNFYRQRQVFANMFANIKLPLGITYRINWINRLSDTQDYRFRPSEAAIASATGSRADINRYNWMIDNILKWNKVIADMHEFDVTLLYNVEENQYWYSSQGNSEFDPNESLSYHNLSIGASPVINQNDTRSTGNAFMARLNYVLMDKYIATVSVRRDGYSAFGQKNPYAVFPAVALGWRISDENFFDVGWLSNLKLRLSWGENGNREIGQYVALSRMNTMKYIYDHSSVTGIYTTNLANQELKWERTETYNVGIDFGLIEGRVSGSLDVYHMSTTDLLLRRSLPNITGYQSVFANLGEVQNQGMELALNTVNIDRSNFRWNSVFSFWFNRNEIKHLYGDMVDILDDNGNVIGQREEDDIQNGWYIGHGIDQIFDYEIAGVWQLDEEEEAGNFGKAPGDVKLVDQNGDGIINFDDQIFQGYTRPRYRISFRNDFTWGNFDFSLLLNSFLDYYGANNEHFNYRTSQERLNKTITPYWTVDNPTNEWTRLYSNNQSPRTTWWENKSFVRLQNLTVGYTIPVPLLQKVDINRLRIYGNIQNFPAISGWQYNWDVETSNPTPMIYTLGVELSL